MEIKGCKGAQVTEILTAVLVVTFGTSTWVALSGIWLELPLLTSYGIPEGYRIGSQVVVAIQAAIIGPLLFAALQLVAPKNYRLEIPAIYVILTVGSVACFLMIFFWNAHSVWSLDHDEHSTALLVLIFFVALVDSTSNLTFMPFVSSLKAMYINWYFIGEGLSSVIPSLVVLIQGAGGVDKCTANYSFINSSFDPITNVTIVQNCTEMVLERTGGPLFPPEYYDLFLFVLLALSVTSFCLLRCVPLFRGQYEMYETLNDETSESKEQKQTTVCECVAWYCMRRSFCPTGWKTDAEKTRLLSNSLKENQREQQQKSMAKQTTQSLVQATKPVDSPACLLGPTVIVDQNINVLTEHVEQKTNMATLKTLPKDNSQEGNKREETLCTIVEEQEENTKKSSSRASARYAFLFTVLTTISATTYGVLPSIQSYSAVAYGREVYLHVAAFAEMSVPVGFFLVLLRPCTNNLVVLLTSLAGLVAGGYCMAAAVLCPSPPFVDYAFGELFIVLAWVLQGFFFSYCRATIGLILRDETRSRVLMMGFGACTTLGTMIGAVVMFPIVNVLHVLQDFDLAIVCPDNLTCVDITPYDATLNASNIHTYL